MANRMCKLSGAVLARLVLGRALLAVDSMGVVVVVRIKGHHRGTNMLGHTASNCARH